MGWRANEVEHALVNLPLHDGATVERLPGPGVAEHASMTRKPHIDVVREPMGPRARWHGQRAGERAWRAALRHRHVDEYIGQRG